MKIYNYHQLTGELLGESIAEQDPLDQENWLIPANATDITPPDYDVDTVVVFENNEWVIKPDYRGTKYYIGQTEYEMTEIGDIPLDASFEKPPLSVEEQYAIDVSNWKLERSIAVESIIVLYNKVEYQGDEKSQDRMSRAINGLPDSTTTIPWVAADNTVHQLNKTDLQSILFDAGTQQALIWNEGRPVAP